MDSPQGPRDLSLRVIIDKLAEFVARNGPEFEKITKQKQQENPKFDFLFGGEHAAYYQYRVAMEQSCLQQQTQQQQLPAHIVQQITSVGHFAQAPPPTMQHHQGPPPLNAHEGTPFQMNQPPPTHRWGPSQQVQQNAVAAATIAAAVVQQANGNALTLSLTAQIEAINMQQGSLREQIRQSEANLTAQHSALMKQQTQQIDEAIETAQNNLLDKQAEEHGIILREFDSILQPIIESCTKDSISSGKNWILQHSADSAKNNIVLQYLLKKALLSGSTFQQKLHLIYLVNDILHHCVRKNVNDLKNSLENVVIPMFCSADLIATPEQRQKLNKLLSLWESKAKFFDACVISKLQSPDSSMQEYKTNLQNTHHEIVTQMTATTKNTLDNYKKQHQMFVQHATQQITQLEQQKQQLEQQILANVLPNTNIMPPQQHQQQQQTTPNKIPSLMSQKITMPIDDTPPGVDEIGTKLNQGVNMFQSQQQQQGHNNHGFNFQQQQSQAQKNNPFGTPKDDMCVGGTNFFIPDMSKPPPGFSGQLNSAQPQQPPPLMQQQLHNNIPTNANNINAQNVAQSTGQQENMKNLTIDMVALNAAIQLVKHRQHHQQTDHQIGQQQQQRRNNNSHSETDDAPPPPPSITMLEPNRASTAYYDLPAGHLLPQQMQIGQQQQQRRINNAHGETDDAPPPPPSVTMLDANRVATAYYDLPAGQMMPQHMQKSTTNESEERHPVPSSYYDLTAQQQIRDNGEQDQQQQLTATGNIHYDIPNTVAGVAALIMPVMSINDFNKLPLQQQQQLLQHQLQKLAGANISDSDATPQTPALSMLDATRATNAYYDLAAGLMLPMLNAQQAKSTEVNDNERPPPPPTMTQVPAYYDLPAGLMVPLINLNDNSYKPLDPADICLPPPAPQSERLTNALAAFYSLPTHDRPRDNEGWEKLGLYEYYKVKNAARKEKEEKIKKGLRERTRSPSPIIIEQPKPKKINKRTYRSRSRSLSKPRSPNTSKSRSRSRSHSRSPPLRARNERDLNNSRSGSNITNDGNSNASRMNRYNQRQRSPVGRLSPQRDRDSRDYRDNRSDRGTNTRRERERSMSPPSFHGGNFAKPNEVIGQTNKGHQMLMKMGWTGLGTGLGTKNQGIDQPILPGDVRDRKDQFKGVGVSINDPFENFRKNKGAAFVHRMRARDEKS